jgi:putative flavoprotein involved in K+ transport
VDRYHLPVRYRIRVTGIEQQPRGGYIARSDQDVFDAANVVVVTGLFQRSRVPPFGSHLPAQVQQLSSDAYRNPDALAPGAVLVVGSAQSGFQIAEELYQSGRQGGLIRGRPAAWY